jgi:hypothetical protein
VFISSLPIVISPVLVNDRVDDESKLSRLVIGLLSIFNGLLIVIGTYVAPIIAPIVGVVPSISNLKSVVELAAESKKLVATPPLEEAACILVEYEFAGNDLVPTNEETFDSMSLPVYPVIFCELPFIRLSAVPKDDIEIIRSG